MHDASVRLPQIEPAGDVYNRRNLISNVIRCCTSRVGHNSRSVQAVQKPAPDPIRGGAAQPEPMSAFQQPAKSIRKGYTMPGIFEVSVETNFSAAHALRGYQGDCARLHGHNWTVRVSVSCRE